VNKIKDEEIKNFIIKHIEKKSKLPKNTDFTTFNYIETGYIDSIGIIKFIVEIEQKFNVQISEDDIMSEKFKTVNGLADIIKRNINE
jgi:acyl carrier protein